MARLKPAAELPPSRIELGLGDPGMTPLLRAGLGGLAASLNTLAPGALPGTWTVEPRRVVLDWGQPGGAREFLEALFQAAFRLSSAQGLIDLPGAWTELRDPALQGALQDALRVTILQHGLLAKKEGPATPYTFELNGEPTVVSLQRYSSYVQQVTVGELVKALLKPPSKAAPIQLASWAQPGAVQRHAAVGGSNMEYTPAQALCACFALVGTFSFRLPRGGVLVVAVPSDLVAFARLRPLLTPTHTGQVTVSGVGDAALAVEVALRQAQLQARAPDALEEVHAYRLRSTAWASQQKSRVDNLGVGALPDALLDRYEALSRLLPPRLVRVAAKKGQEASSFYSPSNLRALVCDNLARGLPWYRGFATARDFDGERALHTEYRSDNKGALRSEEKEALRMLNQTLEGPEATLVRAVHEALRRRLGAIADENRDNPAALKNRMDKERERLRLALAGAKTHQQVRFTLADLWSRAGTVRELQEHWTVLLPLLGEARWQDARDLALVALASYKGRSSDNTTQDTAPETGEDL